MSFKERATHFKAIIAMNKFTLTVTGNTAHK